MKKFAQVAALLVAATPVAAQTTVFGGNLIVNGGAESGPGSDGTATVSTVPGWSRTGGCDVYAYSTAYNQVEAVGPKDFVPSGAGNNYFAGGSKQATCTFAQTIDLSSGAATIDAGTITFAAAGYFGGYSSDTDNATLNVVFEDGTGAQLKSITVGGVGPNDRPSGENGLSMRRLIGQVPAKTRKATLTLNMNWVNGNNNDAFADNLSLILNQPQPAQSLLGINLIVNPGADASLGYNDNSGTEGSADLPGWVRSAFFTSDSYQHDSGGDLYQYTGGPTDAGSNYFYGGVDVTDPSNPSSTGFQDIDVSSAASLIDAGNLPYALSAWLGATQTKMTTVCSRFSFRTGAAQS